MDTNETLRDIYKQLNKIMWVECNKLSIKAPDRGASNRKIINTIYKQLDIIFDHVK